MFFFTQFVCFAAFLVYTGKSSQLTSGLSQSVQEQKECTPMEHHLGSACHLIPFLYFSTHLSTSTFSTFYIPGHVSVNRNSIFQNIHL